LLADSIADGIRAVQYQDMVATKLFFEDPILREAAMKPRATQLLGNFSRALKTACPSAPGFQVVDDLQSWTRPMLDLKRTLMLGNKDYRIHFIRPSPDSKFDPKWMEAITADASSFKKPNARALRVRLYLFPAIVEYDAQLLVDGSSVEDALTSNRKFFSPFKNQDLKPRRCIAKAYVVLM
jgi:hypothetical protein